MSLLCLVPTALRASRVTRRLCDAQDGVLFGRQATTFDALAASIVAASGDRRPILGPLAERLLAVEAGREEGGPLGALSASDGLAAALSAAVGELRRGEVSAEEALAAAGALAGAPRRRLESLAGVLARYERRLDALGLLDRAAALRAAADADRRRVRAPETEAVSLLLLDGFSSLSPAEWALFAALAARAGAVRVHLPHLADLPKGTAAAEPLARQVEALHELASVGRVEIVSDRVDDPRRAPRVAAALAAMAGGTPGPAAGGGEVRGVAAAGEGDEARAVAAAAAAWIAGGIDPAELRVFSPAPGADAARLARAFAEAGVPFASGRGVPLVDLPVVRLLREAMGAAGGLTRRGAERLARSSYLSLGAPAERLAALLDRAGALDGRALPAAALRRRAATLGRGGGRERAGLGQAAGRIEALERLLAPLAEPGTARRHAARLAAFVDAAGIRRRAARAEPPIAAQDLAAIGRVEDAAEELSRALAHLGRGEETLAAGTWVALLDAALAGCAAPAAGEPFGAAVELCGLDDAPGETARGALLVGCSRGRLPAAPAAEPLLREPERQALCARLRRRAVATAGARREEALHRAVCAAAAGREALLFAWRTEDGPFAPIVEAALGAVSEAPIATAGRAAPLGEARSEREALRSAVRLGPSARDAMAGLLGPALAERLGRALARGRIEAERRAAVDAGTTAPHAGGVAPEELAASLPAEWSATQLEDYARCPYRLFVTLGARVPSREAAGVEIDPRDEGRLLHAALERFVAGRAARGDWPPRGGAADREEALAAADAVFAKFEEAGRTGDPSVWAARRRAVRERLARWVEAEARDADGLVPRLLEHAFGGTSGRPPLRLGEGEGAVLLQGRIDRVDADGRRLLVLDYKNSRADKERRALLDPASFGVTSFQLPLYLAAAARDLPGRAELGATYALLREGRRLEPFRGAASELAAGALGPELEAAVRGTVDRIRAGRFPLVSRDCERCDYGAVCRAQGAAEVEEGGEP